MAASTSTPSPYQLKLDAIRGQVESKIADNRIMIFSKSWCPYCRAAKSLFSELSKKEEYAGLSYEVMEIDIVKDGDAIQDYLASRPEGQRTVPNIFINQKHIGGNSDLQALHKRGKLSALIKESATPRL